SRTSWSATPPDPLPLSAGESRGRTSRPRLFHALSWGWRPGSVAPARDERDADGDRDDHDGEAHDRADLAGAGRALDAHGAAVGREAAVRGADLDGHGAPGGEPDPQGEQGGQARADDEAGDDDLEQRVDLDEHGSLLRAAGQTPARWREAGVVGVVGAGAGAASVNGSATSRRRSS